MKRPKRVRKPRMLWVDEIPVVGSTYSTIYLSVDDYYMSIKKAKRLHSWLTKAIQYIEQEGKK